MLISGGQLTPVGYADEVPQRFVNYYPNVGISITGGAASYGAIYKSQVWVHTLVNKLAFGTARLPLKVYERTAEGRDEARDTPYAQLLRNPNPRHDPFFFWLWTASTFEVYGEALWLKVRPRPGAAPTQLWPIHPSNVFLQRKDDGRLVYVYHLGSAADGLAEWEESDVVHFKSYNPETQTRGLSRLEPLRQTIVNEDAARRASAAFWGNGGRPSMALTHPSRLSPDALTRLKEQWDSIHSGVDNWGKTAVLEEGMTPHFMPLNAEEMQYIESRRLNREEVCAAYDVPPPVVHILDRATFSNVTEQMRSMYRDTMAPRLGLYESVLESSLRPDFDPQGRLYAEFLMDEVLRGAFEARAVANQAAINSGQRTPNEVRRLDNLPPLEGGDRLYINAASIPLGDAALSPPTGTDVVTHPQGVKMIEGATVCAWCDVDGAVSVRGLCRSCEGKRARAVEHVVKEITP